MTCAECDGDGMLFVQEGYVDRHCPIPDGFDGLTDREKATIFGQRAGLRNSVYPCPTCAPERFSAWSQGAFAVAPLGTRSTVPPAARRVGFPAKPRLPLEPPSDLGPEDWTNTRRDLQ